MTSQTNPAPRGVTRLHEKLAAVLIAALGGLLVAFMSLAALSEFLLGDFFGVMVSLMVVLFGLLLFRSGYEKMARKPPGQAIRRWEAVSKAYPYLPLSRARADGR